MQPETGKKNPMGNPIVPSLFHSKTNKGLPLLFLIFISLPLLEGILPITHTTPLNEKRKLAAKPHVSLRDPFGYLEKLSSYFNDNFGFRDRLIHWHNVIQLTVLRMSPLAKVIMGREGWLFLGRETKRRDEMNYFRSINPFTEAELEHWRSIVQQRRQWLHRRGIVYLFMVIPNKSTMYPEYLPCRIRKANPKSRLDQLLTVLRRDPDFPALDFRELLTREKKNHLLFYRTDTHWTAWGAYFAYREIMRKLAAVFPGVCAAPLDQFTIGIDGDLVGDLALLLSLHHTRFKEQKIDLRAKNPPPIAVSSAKSKLGPFIRKIVSECPSGTLPTALIVHDSFMHELKPFLRPHFRRIIYIWDWDLHFFAKVIEKEKPAIVIDEIVERALCDLKIENPPEVKNAFGR